MGSRGRRGQIIFLNGTSSSGKSSIAGQLLLMLDPPHFHVSVGAINGMRAKQKTRELDDAALAAVLTRTRAGFHRAVAGLAEAGNDVVMDHVLSEPWRLLDCLAVMAGYRVVFVGVRCAPAELERRERERGDQAGAHSLRPAQVAAAMRASRHIRFRGMSEPWDPAAPGILRLPSGRLVRGRGLGHPMPDGPSPSFGVYLLGRRPPPFPWESRWIRWPDFRLPAGEADVLPTLTEAWERAAAERVEIACKGGHGRTGTALACLAILDGVPGTEAVAFVREHYDRHAVETPAQRRYVAHWPGKRE